MWGLSIPWKISTKTNPNQTDRVVRELFSFFASLQSPCSSSPCQHEATCVTNYRDGSFGCRCAKGFKGEYCEKGE